MLLWNFLHFAQMKVKVVVFNHNQRSTAEKLYSSLAECFDVALFDSGSAPDEISPATTHHFGNLYWTGCWNKAWELFSDYDVIWGIGGDCVLNSAPKDFKNAIETVPSFGIWSPAILSHARPYMKLTEPKALSVKFVEGIAFALSKILWTEVGHFDAKNYIGWGQDVIHSHYSRECGMRNILDGRVQLHHPPSVQYNEKTAQILMQATISRVLGADGALFKTALGKASTVHLNTIEELSCTAPADVANES